MGKKQTYADYLIKRGKDYEEHKREMKEQLQADKEDKECTFKPKTISAPIDDDASNNSPGSHRKGSKFE